MEHETKKEIKKFSLIGANKGKQVRYEINEYVDGVLFGESETVYEEIKDEDIAVVSNVVPLAHCNKAKSISKLIKGNNEHLDEIRNLDSKIAEKEAKKKVKK